MGATKAGAANVGALSGDRLQPRKRKLTAHEATERRKASERIYGARLPVSSYERDLYEAEGLTPPVE